MKKVTTIESVLFDLHVENKLKQERTDFKAVLNEELKGQF